MTTSLEATDQFLPRFDSAGLITAVVTDARDGRLLMVAHMNAEALGLTLETGQVHFWSRSRGALWRKGETSGETLQLVEILTDCDQDALQVRALPSGRGAVCHTGRKTCFYRRIRDGRLEATGDMPLFDPQDVYRA